MSMLSFRCRDSATGCFHRLGQKNRRPSGWSASRFLDGQLSARPSPTPSEKRPSGENFCRNSTTSTVRATGDQTHSTLFAMTKRAWKCMWDCARRLHPDRHGGPCTVCRDSPPPTSLPDRSQKSTLSLIGIKDRDAARLDDAGWRASRCAATLDQRIHVSIILMPVWWKAGERG